MKKDRIIIVASLLIIIVLLVGVAVSMLNFNKKDTALSINCNSTVYEGGSIEVQLTDLDGNPIADENVNVTITNTDNVSSVYSVKTNENGIGVLKLDKTQGSYVINATYSGNDKYAGSSADKNITVEKKATQASGDSSDSSAHRPRTDREEDQITPDGWDPLEHEVSREPLDNGYERVNYDDGYFVVVDSEGNIITHGF